MQASESGQNFVLPIYMQRTNLLSLLSFKCQPKIDSGLQGGAFAGAWTHIAGNHTSVDASLLIRSSLLGRPPLRESASRNSMVKDIYTAEMTLFKHMVNKQ